jgi:hypothetical protein
LFSLCKKKSCNRFNDFIKDDFIPEGDGQVVSGSASLPDPVVLETKDLTLEREQDERDVLEALDEYKCDTGMPVANVSGVVNIKTLNGQDDLFHTSSLLGSQWV